MIAALLLGSALAVEPTPLDQQIDSIPARPAPRTIAIDERLGTDANLHVGDRIIVSPTPGQLPRKEIAFEPVTLPLVTDVTIPTLPAPP